MSSKNYLKISRTWSFNSKVSRLFDNHVRQSIPLYNEFHTQVSKIAEFYCKDDSVIYDLGCSMYVMFDQWDVSSHRKYGNIGNFMNFMNYIIFVNFLKNYHH